MRVPMVGMAAFLVCGFLAPVATAKDVEMVIDSVPTGARVEMNGNTIGTTPLRRTYPHTYFDPPNTIWSKYLAERAVITLYKDGYLPKTVELTHGPFLWRNLAGGTAYSFYLLEKEYTIHLESIIPEAAPPSSRGAVRISHGTGFHTVAPGYFVTNFHVVRDGQEITVERKRNRCPATIAASDQANDLAILKVDSTCVETLQLSGPLKLISSRSLGAGADVTTYGYPLPQEFGAEPQVSKGIVKSMTGLDADPRTLTISNSIQPGNSGGPLFTHDGEVVGVVTSTMNANYLYPRYEALPQDLNFAVKSDYVTLLFQVAGIRTAEQSIPPAAEQTRLKESSAAAPQGPPSNLEMVEQNLVLITVQAKD